MNNSITVITYYSHSILPWTLDNLLLAGFASFGDTVLSCTTHPTKLSCFMSDRLSDC